ncbi:MAG: lysozyme inhibitor LprI family protein [Jannaschia sp.]
MRALILAAVAAAIPGLGTAQPCIGRQDSTIAATQCLSHRAQIADDELNRLWRVLKPAADRAGWGDRLLREQRAWLRRRDARCEPELDSEGTGGPMFFYACILEETESRNGEFRRMMR